MESARVRLSINRCDDKPEYIIESSSLDPKTYQWNEAGLSIGIFEDARKSCDAFANLKSANRLPYVMAGLYAIENSLDDCLLLNTEGNIADSTISNLFLIRDDMIITPSLDEGCVAGVMRRYLISKLQAASYQLQERSCSIKDLFKADEVFLTNAIRGIQWVRSYKRSVYEHKRTREIFDQFIENLKPVSLQNGD